MFQNLRFTLDRLAGRGGGAWPLHKHPRVVPRRGKLSRAFETCLKSKIQNLKHEPLCLLRRSACREGCGVRVHSSPGSAGIMVFEKFIRYASLAVGLKPSATGCEAHRRGLYRIIFSKTILPAEKRRGRNALAHRRVCYARCEQVRLRVGPTLWLCRCLGLPTLWARSAPARRRQRPVHLRANPRERGPHRTARPGRGRRRP